jgi:catalase
MRWSEEREQVDIGTLSIDDVSEEAAGGCHNLNFDPLILPPGIEPSDDPLIFARSAAYAESFRRRAREAGSVAPDRADSPTEVGTLRGGR